MNCVDLPTEFPCFRQAASVHDYNFANRNSLSGKPLKALAQYGKTLVSTYYCHYLFVHSASHIRMKLTPEATLVERASPATPIRLTRSIFKATLTAIPAMNARAGLLVSYMPRRVDFKTEFPI